MTKNVAATSYSMSAAGTGGTFNSWEPTGAAPSGDWQLAATNYVDRSVDPVLIHPRPDSETPVWAKHRRQHPSAPYRIPIGISFGSWPFYFESITMPTGATVGSFLTTSGDKLVVGADYGVVHWDTPTIGTHSFHVRVHFQDGYTPIDVEWTLEVTTTGTIFIDPVGGNDTTGDGTYALPFKTADAWWKNDDTDYTYSEYQVCYRAGTHDVGVTNTLTSSNYGNWLLNGTDKPLVHYGYYGESVIFDMSDTEITVGNGSGNAGLVGSDTYWGGIEFNGLLGVRDDPRHFSYYAFAAGAEAYTAADNGHRNTWFETTHKDVVIFTKATNNAGVLWSNDAGVKKRHYWYQSKTTFENCHVDATATDTSTTNFNGFYQSNTINWLSENGTAIDTEFGKAVFEPKTGARYFCMRNVDHTAAAMQNLILTMAGSYDVNDAGPYEISYCKINNQDTRTIGHCLTIQAGGTYDELNPNHQPVYSIRNTMSRSPTTSRSVMTLTSFSWPYYDFGNIYVADDILYSNPDPVADGSNFISYDIASNPLDANINLTGAERTTHLGKYGAEVAE